MSIKYLHRDKKPALNMGGKRFKEGVHSGAYYVFNIILFLLFIFPLFWSVMNSFKPPMEAAASPPTYFMSEISINNYQKFNKYGSGVWLYITNSGIVSIGTVLGAIILSTLAGYGFSRFSFRGKNLIFFILLSTLMIPFQSILIPLFIVFTRVNLHNSLLGLILIYITFQLPFGVFIMRNTFDMIPREIEEAALIDGCNSLNLLWHVMLRLASPGIVTIAISAFLAAWNEFIIALIMLLKDTKYTLPILLTSIRTGYYGSIDWGALQAGITVTILPSMILFLLLQRYYIQGLSSGAVK